jgi:hypothetical protein
VTRITERGEEKHEAFWGKQRQRVAVGGLVALRFSLEGTKSNRLKVTTNTNEREPEHKSRSSGYTLRHAYEDPKTANGKGHDSLTNEAPIFPAGLTANVREVLTNFLASAQAAFSEDLQAAVLFGSAAEGALRKSSDVNLILVLRRFVPERAQLLRNDLETAEAAILLRVMFLTQDEIPAAGEAFAQKFSDILRRRVVLLGPDPFAGLTISHAAQVRRLRQVLLNLLLRLRETYTGQDVGSRSALSMLAESTGALQSSAVLLLVLEGREAPKPKQALMQVAEQVAPGKFADALAKLSQLRENGALPDADAQEVMIGMMELAAAMHRSAAALND